MDEGGIPHIHRRPIGDEELLAVKIIKGSGLFGQQIDSGLLQVKIRRSKPELLERDLFRADFVRFDGFFDLLFQVFVDLIARDQFKG